MPYARWWHVPYAVLALYLMERATTHRTPTTATRTPPALLGATWANVGVAVRSQVLAALR